MYNYTFFPSLAVALEIFLLSRSAKSCTAQRSFSTLRCVKTWLRSTTGVHREKVNSGKEKFIENALLTQFGRECPRRLKCIIIDEKECITVIPITAII